MRSLLVCDNLPDPAFGTGQRVLLLYRALAALGECRTLLLAPDDADVVLGRANFWAPLPIAPDAQRWAWIRRLVTFADYRVDSRYASVMARIRREFEFDLVFCSFFRTAVAAPTDKVPCFLDVDALPPETGPVSRWIAPITRRMMQRRSREFAKVFVIREEDRSVIQDAIVLPGLSLTARLPDPSAGLERRNVLFVGSMAWPPNRLAVEAMLAAGLPRSLARSGFQLRLVGSGTDAFEPRSGLSGAGFVNDLNEEYARAALVLCPVNLASGANIKLAEALQSGCAVLSSPSAARAFAGIVKPGEDVELVRENELLSTAIERLLTDDQRLQELRARARAVATSVLDVARIERELSETIRIAIGSPSQSG